MNIQEIIKKYTNSYGIITEINKMIKELRNNYSDNELSIILKEVIIYNNKKYKEINSSANNQIKCNTNNNTFHTISNIENEKIMKQDVSGINIDVSNHFDQIIDCENDLDLLTIINQINDKMILTVLKFKLQEYITYLKKELLANISLEDSIYCKNEIDRITNTLNYIINYETIISSKNSINSNNKLIFLNDENKILFLEDLEEIDPSEYQAFHSLLSSIVIGTFNGNKSVIMTKNNKIPEIRRTNGQRIIYDKICNNYYIILFAFDKNNNFIYKSKLVERYNLYMKKKAEIQNLILCNNQKFLNEQFQTQEKVLNLLRSKKGRGLNG